MSQNYLDRVRDNILPLSKKKTLPEAFAEWFFTESTVDHILADEECELCDQQNIRYHFEIKNRNTHHTLWVGSSCILKFQIQVFEKGKVLSTADAKKKLDKLTEKMRYESCVKALEKVAEEEKNDILTNALTYYKKEGYLTPKYAAVVLWRLNKNTIDYNPSFFKISLRKKKYKEDLKDMPQFKIHTIWKALSTSQKEIAKKFGFKPPKN